MEFPGQVEAAQQHNHSADLSDMFLVEQLQCGCSECFSVLFHRYCHTVYSIAWNLLRDRGEAEDIVQDVFLSIHLKRSRYDYERGTVKTWILQNAHFTSLTRRRQLKGVIFDSIETGSGGDPHLVTCLQSRDVDANRECWIERGLTLINESQRKVIELVHFDGYTLLESSKLIGESLANTRNLYYRGMKLLRKSLMPASVNDASNVEITESRRVLLQPKTPVLEH